MDVSIGPIDLQPWEFTAAVLLPAIAVILFFVVRAWLRRRKQSVLEKNWVTEFYPMDVIRRSVRYYVPPNSKSVSQGHGPEIRQDISDEPLFDKMDKLLDEDSGDRHFMLFADSGMGKSSFVLNYYARNQLRSRRKRRRLVVVPLGRPDVDRDIKSIGKKGDTILFLDAFNEDTRATGDPEKRLAELIDLCRDFKRVLLTCRTQFLSRQQEGSDQTGILRIEPRDGTIKKAYELRKLYLAPLNKTQINEFVYNRFRFWRPLKRHYARSLVERLPFLSGHPAFLSYIPDLIKQDISVDYSFQLYELLVNKWCERQSSWIVPETLKEFAETLAIELYTGRAKRGGEFMPVDEVISFADTLEPNAKSWKLNGDSLITRDAKDNFRFSQRSVMEYLFVERFLKLPASQRREMAWTDQMKMFVFEMLKVSMNKTGASRFSFDKIDFKGFPEPLYDFRKKPCKVTNKEAADSIKRHDFYCGGRSPWSYSDGRGALHHFEKVRGNKAIRDTMSGLHWQQSGSSKSMTLVEAQTYIDRLNHDKYAGFSDWRLPTLEEAMSLMEPQKNKTGLHIASVFDRNQQSIWISDKKFALAAWYVDYGSGYCNVSFVYDVRYSVRAVR
jgi:hypothetical protein